MFRLTTLGGLFFLFFLSFQVHGQAPRWMQQPAISPDGQWIAFSYKGDLFKVSSTGGQAIPLTITSYYEGHPVWSHDGKTIAYASDRYGNFDVYVMPAEGGEGRRLTFHSAEDIPTDFTVDNQKVLFRTARNTPAKSVRFPSPRFFKMLYTVPVTGGRSLLFNAAGAEFAHYNKAGDHLLFMDCKGYESFERKHERASITRDIWLWHPKTDQYKQLTFFDGNDMEPVWGEDHIFYYLSEKNDDHLNVYKGSIDRAESSNQQLTHFKKDPVRSLSRSQNGILCFTQGGYIYTLREGEQAQKVAITLQADFAQQSQKTLQVGNKQISEMALSPNGKEVAFIYRGDLYATSTDGKTTKRLTNTPYQERMIEFSPDGRSIIYSVEKDGSWDIEAIHLTEKREPYFYVSTLTETMPIVATEKDEFQALYSPDGKKIAYLEERNIIKVKDLASGATVTILPQGINYSYSDGDQNFTWSPDSKWLLVESEENTITRNEILLISADGKGERKNITESGFGNYNPKWGLNGKAMLWESDRQGMRNPARGSQGDVYALFFDQAAFDRFNLSQKDFELKKELEKEEKKEKEKKEKENKKDKGKSSKKEEPLVLNTDHLESRTKRLTLNSSLLSDYVLSKDGEKLYYLAKTDEKYQLWETEPRTRKTKVLARLNANTGGSIAIDTAGKNIFVIAGGTISQVDVEKGEVKPLAINTQFNLNQDAERAYLLDHTYYQVIKKHYDPKLQGVDWDYYYQYHKQFLPHINNNYDFRTLLSEFLGELNVSHTGARYYPPSKGADQTASLGMFFREKEGGNGLIIDEIIKGGPMDKAKTKVRKGDRLMKIDGHVIDDTNDWAKYLNQRAGTFTRLTYTGPGGKTWEEVIKPISLSEEQDLLYDRWVKTMQDMTDSLSGGRIGYVHIQGMNDPSFRTVINKVLGKNFDKEALVVDTRFNGGGWLHDHLVTFLGGKLYMQFGPQGHLTKGGESADKWNKPSVVLMSEGNYSDAFMFPYIYKYLNLGKLIGMPVPGTGTAVWWERQIDPTIVFGIPMIGTKGVKETHWTENHQLEPDIKIDNPYHKVLNGIDQQLQRSVDEMLKEVSK